MKKSFTLLIVVFIISCSSPSSSDVSCDDPVEATFQRQISYNNNVWYHFTNESEDFYLRYKENAFDRGDTYTLCIEDETIQSFS